MTKHALTQEVFVCDCNTVEHQFVITYDNDPTDDFLYIEPRLNHYLPFYKRILQAIQYVFNRADGSYDTIVLRKNDMQRLVDVVNKKLDTL